MGSDLGGAVKGFKDGMKDASDDGASETSGSRADSLPRAKDTVDVEARDRSNQR